jgi:hypothetical protein
VAVQEVVNVMPEPTDEADKWRLRERAMFIAVATWSIGVSILLTFRPWAVRELISRQPMVVGATILLSIGVLGAVGHITLLLLHNRSSGNYDQELTEWDG